MTPFDPHLTSKLLKLWGQFVIFWHAKIFSVLTIFEPNLTPRIRGHLWPWKVIWLKMFFFLYLRNYFRLILYFDLNGIAIRFKDKLTCIFTNQWLNALNVTKMQYAAEDVNWLIWPHEILMWSNDRFEVMWGQKIKLAKMANCKYKLDG